MRRKLLAAIAVAVVAAGAGGAYAATQSSNSNPRKAYLDDVAKRLHVSPQQLSSALKGAALDQIQALVADGRITQAQANAIKRRIQLGGKPGFFGGPPAPPGFFGGPVRPPGFFGAKPGGPRAFGVQGHRGALQAVAGALGLTPPQLFQQLASGKTLAQIATSRGKSVSALKDAIYTAVKGRLDRAVAAKVITKAQEQAVLSRLSARLDRLVNRSLPRFGFRAEGRGMRWHVPPPAGVPVPAPPAGAPGPGVPGP